MISKIKSVRPITGTIIQGFNTEYGPMMTSSPGSIPITSTSNGLPSPFLPFHICPSVSLQKHILTIPSHCYTGNHNSRLLDVC